MEDNVFELFEKLLLSESYVEEELKLFILSSENYLTHEELIQQLTCFHKTYIKPLRNGVKVEPRVMQLLKYFVETVGPLDSTLHQSILNICDKSTSEESNQIKLQILVKTQFLTISQSFLKY